jgi:hypothetical protein
MAKEIYHIDVQVRDENGKILKGLSVDKSTINPKPSIQFELEVYRVQQLEANIKQIASTLRTWLPTGYEINIEASVLNIISGTYMTMYSFYEGEDRFVKH